MPPSCKEVFSYSLEKPISASTLRRCLRAGEAPWILTYPSLHSLKSQQVDLRTRKEVHRFVMAVNPPSSQTSLSLTTPCPKRVALQMEEIPWWGILYIRSDRNLPWKRWPWHTLRRKYLLKKSSLITSSSRTRNFWFKLSPLLKRRKPIKLLVSPSFQLATTPPRMRPSQDIKSPWQETQLSQTCKAWAETRTLSVSERTLAQL